MGINWSPAVNRLASKTHTYTCATRDLSHSPSPYMKTDSTASGQAQARGRKRVSAASASYKPQIITKSTEERGRMIGSVIEMDQGIFSVPCIGVNVCLRQ